MATVTDDTEEEVERDEVRGELGPDQVRPLGPISVVGTLHLL